VSKKADAPAEWVSPDTLKPWPGNPRRNDGKPVEAVAKSIERFGFAAPIVARREDGEIIAGHTRWKAAQKLGLTKVPVRFMDLGDREAHLLALADNRQTELTPWDEPMLAEALSDFGLEDAELAGWDSEALGALADVVPDFGPLDSFSDEVEGEDAELPEPPEEPVTKLGDLWLLGEHRLLCGDSTDVATLRRALDGRQAAMVFTDPPYGVNYVGKTGDALEIENDGEAGLPDLLRASFAALLGVTEPGAPWYVCAPSGPLTIEFGQQLRAIDVLRQRLVWVKDAFVLGRSDYHYRHEDIYYGWTPGGPHRPPPDRKQDSVWEFARPRRNKEHPTMKPVPLVRHALEMSADPGALVVEPFGGSGTTLIACEETSRRCGVVELSPAYCDVIVERWENLTGGKATRESH
jgi:site-specific DNA-methyltransferase (adenine-specific)